MGSRKSWREKLTESRDLPRVELIPKRMESRWGKGTLLIPAPLEVDHLMRRIPKGRLTTVNEIRRELASSHGATICCPMTTGIFVWIAANAAAEDESTGLKRITPWWRTLKSDGELNPKYPGGVEAQRERLEAEGHQVVARGRKLFVREYERLLAPLS